MDRQIQGHMQNMPKKKTKYYNFKIGEEKKKMLLYNATTEHKICP